MGLKGSDRGWGWGECCSQRLHTLLQTLATFPMYQSSNASFISFKREGGKEEEEEKRRRRRGGGEEERKETTGRGGYGIKINLKS